MSTSFDNLLHGIQLDVSRDHRFLHLTPNEAVMSDVARKFMTSTLNDRYYFGPGENGVMDNGHFTALGLSGVGAMVDVAELALKKMLGAEAVNLNCLSGVHAMMCVVLSVTEPGDTVMTLHHDHGGHFATKGILQRTGRHTVDTVYDFESQSFDVEATARIFREGRAKLLYLDMSYHTSPVDVSLLRSAIGDDALIAYDASHTIGLMLGGVIESPLREGADIVCANTHKTLPGPQKGLIAFRSNLLGEKANTIINAGLYSSTHTGSLLALATTILEMEQYGAEYARQVVKNSQALGASLASCGFDVRKNSDGSYSKTHQVHVLTERIGQRRQVYDQLYKNSIAVAFDSPTILKNGTFIRLGTQEITRRGMKEDDMAVIADFMRRAVSGEDLHEEVEGFKCSFPGVEYSFDATNSK